MEIIELLNYILYIVLTMILPVVATYAVNLIKAKIKESNIIADATQNENTAKIIEHALSDVMDAVLYINQIYVDALKSNGKFDKDAQKNAFNRAYTEALNMISEESQKVIEQLYGSFDKWLKSKIETSVNLAKGRNNPMRLSISENGLALIKRFEGCRLTAYKDSAGIWTIGYGHTSGVLTGQTITQIQADAYLKSDCANAEKYVNQYDNIYHWNQNQFDALVSFTFNCGNGNLKTLLNDGQRTIKEISGKIIAYNKAGGKTLQGLINRRNVEKELFDKMNAIAINNKSQMIKPISYLQTDPKWKNYNYSAKGEKKTIGSSGCGVAVTAMVVATLKDKNVTPITTAEWSMTHGYKALNQGTYYTYFVPQLAHYDIQCKRLNQSNLYGCSSSAYHTEALNALKNGNWIIGCMGKGTWTSSGYFILLYKYENGYVYINDPASTKANRIKNTWNLFAKQVKYMWIIDVPESFKTGITSPVISATIPNNNSYSKRQFIKDVQTAIGAKADGIAGTETLSKTITVSKNKNSRHAVVRPVQKYLNSIGFNCGNTDGIAGVKFDTAVKSYQKKNNCIADGELTKSGNTWKKLLGLK